MTAQIIRLIPVYQPTPAPLGQVEPTALRGDDGITIPEPKNPRRRREAPPSCILCARIRLMVLKAIRHILFGPKPSRFNAPLLAYARSITSPSTKKKGWFR